MSIQQQLLTSYNTRLADARSAKLELEQRFINTKNELGDIQQAEELEPLLKIASQIYHRDAEINLLQELIAELYVLDEESRLLPSTELS